MYGCMGFATVGHFPRVGMFVAAALVTAFRMRVITYNPLSSLRAGRLAGIVRDAKADGNTSNIDGLGPRGLLGKTRACVVDWRLGQRWQIIPCSNPGDHLPVTWPVDYELRFDRKCVQVGLH